MVRASTSFCEFWKSEFMNSSDMSPDASQIDEPPNPAGAGIGHDALEPTHRADLERGRRRGGTDRRLIDDARVLWLQQLVLDVA